jgi:hypothetical protein
MVEINCAGNLSLKSRIKNLELGKIGNYFHLQQGFKTDFLLTFYSTMRMFSN